MPLASMVTILLDRVRRTAHSRSKPVRAGAVAGLDVRVSRHMRFAAARRNGRTAFRRPRNPPGRCRMAPEGDDPRAAIDAGDRSCLALPVTVATTRFGSKHRGTLSDKTERRLTSPPTIQGFNCCLPAFAPSSNRDQAAERDIVAQVQVRFDGLTKEWEDNAMSAALDHHIASGPRSLQRVRPEELKSPQPESPAGPLKFPNQR